MGSFSLFLGCCYVTGLGLGFRVAGNEELEKKTETSLMVYIGTIFRIHSFIPS